MAKSKRKIIALFSDTHAGEKNSLANPEAVKIIDYENTPTEMPIEMTAARHYMWDTWKWGISEIKKLAGKDEIIPIHHGDSIQGTKHSTDLSESRKNQVLLAYYNMLPWAELKNVKEIRIATGTPVHDGRHNDAAHMVCDILNRETKVNAKSAQHYLFDIDGFIIDSAHHGSSLSKRKWLEGNTQRYETKSQMIDKLTAGKLLPSAIVRGHFHDYYATLTDYRAGTGLIHYCWYINLPSFAGISYYARKVTKQIDVLNTGMCAIELIDGKMVGVPEWFVKQTDLTEFNKF